MTPERWQAIEDLFLEMVEQPPAVRARSLELLRRRDPELQRDVEELLAADGEASGYMEWCPHRPHRHLGPYRLERILGQGGMGMVYLAQQLEPIRRKVALKIIRPWLIEREAHLRFEAEGQALARLQHPNIAQVYAAGTTRDGLPFLAMEYVPGTSLLRYCDENRLDLRRRIHLFLELCRGVQHLHQRAILHRDLKPANILVLEEQGRPVPKIIDFGIAKALDHPLTRETMATGDRLLGTPSYLSPEAVQAAKAPAAPDTRSDIYSLGILLYELLVGVLPFETEGASLHRILMRILAGDHPEPSLRLAALEADRGRRLAAARGSDPLSLRRALRGDLDLIVLKAIRQPPAERYGTALELAADLERFLDDRPVLAGPPRPLHRLRKLVKRNRGTTLSVVLVVGLLLAGLVGRSLEARRAHQEAERADQEAKRARDVTAFLVGMFYPAANSEITGQVEIAKAFLDHGMARAHRQFRDRPLTRALLLEDLGIAYRRLAAFGPAEEALHGSLAIRRQELGDRHPDTVSSLKNLATLYMSQGRYGEAEAAFLEVLAFEEDLHGPAHERLAATLNNLGNLYNRRGEYSRAEDCYLRCLKIARQIAADSRSIGKTLMNLGINEATQGRFSSAEAYFFRAVTIFGEEEIEPDPELARALHNLGGAQEAQERYPEAATAYRRSLEIVRRIYGAEHPEVAMTLGNLAAVHVGEGRVEEAEALYLESLEIKEETLGPDHPSLAAGLLGLGVLYRQQKRWAEAEPLVARALEIHRARLRPDHPRIAHALTEEALLHRGQGRNDRALETLREALAIYRDNGLETDPGAVEARKHLEAWTPLVTRSTWFPGARTPAASSTDE